MTNANAALAAQAAPTAVLEPTTTREEGGLFAAFLVGYGPATRKAYALDLRCFASWCAANGLPVLEARRAHIDLYARGLEAKGYAPSTVARRLTAVAGLYRYAVAEELLDRSPVQFVRRPVRSDESPRLGLERDESARFLDVAARTGDRDHALACLLMLNGLRSAEACSVDVDDLDTEQGHRVLRLVGKGGKRATVPLAPRTVQAIDEHLAGRTDGPLILANDGGRMSIHGVARVVRRLARQAGVSKRVSPHSLRHTMVTQALRAGVPLHRVQDAARHADPRTTRRYDRAAHSLDEHATYTLAAFVAGGAS